MKNDFQFWILLDAGSSWLACFWDVLSSLISLYMRDGNKQQLMSPCICKFIFLDWDGFRRFSLKAAGYSMVRSRIAIAILRNSGPLSKARQEDNWQLKCWIALLTCLPCAEKSIKSRQDEKCLKNKHEMFHCNLGWSRSFWQWADGIAILFPGSELCLSSRLASHAALYFCWTSEVSFKTSIKKICDMCV